MFMRQLILLIFILAGYPGKSLLSQQNMAKNPTDMPLRIEIPANSVNETYRIIPCGTNGLILFFRSQEVADAARTNWYFTCYDTNFQQIWVKCVPLFNDQDFRFHQITKDTAALLFVSTGKLKNTENKFEMLRIVPNNGTLILNTGILETGAVVDAFGIQKNRAWLGINTKDQAGKILNVELKQGVNKAFPLGNGSQISVLWMSPDTSSNSVSAIVNRTVTKKNVEYYFVRYDTNGLIKHEALIGTQNEERSLTQVKVASTSPTAELLLGTYGQGVTNSSSKNRQIGETTGFFSSQVKTGIQKSISFYNFLELKNAHSIVGEEDIINLKKKALKKKKTLSEYSLDFSVVLHDLIFLHDEYILTAELYSPQYHTESFTDFDFYGRPYTNSYSVFDGYRFFNTIVAGFDTEGKLLWDNNMEIRNLVSSDLSPNVVVYPNGNELVLCYISDGKIGSKIIQTSKVVEKLDFSPLDKLYPDDKIISETKGILNHWYANYFLSFGYQEIKNIALETNNKRLVFYFSKLRFDN